MRKAIKNIVGMQLQAVRVSRGFSQADLAAICQRKGWNLTREIVARIEIGVRCVTDFELLLLADCLEIGVPELLPSARECRKLCGAYLTDLRSAGSRQSRAI